MDTMDPPNPIYLAPTEIIDSNHPKVRDYAKEVAGTSSDPVEQAVKLYLAVRDGIRYDPYTPFHLPEHYRASSVLKWGRAFCIPKASLLCALGRACHIPSRVGFATVKNHLATKQLIDFLGSNVFVFHGFVEFHLEGKWVKATPAFNRELCEKHQVEPLKFNGREDSLFHPYNQENKKYMEYVKYHGTYSDIPVETIVAAWNEAYGKERVDSWIKMFARDKDIQFADFEREDVWQG
ncbi:MAG: transglutaminase-like domain-containing protein [Deltaproteobacteria bacterium]|nr:transglutaminase-like domain-containing protein [Deltaproteobacteria bacterium]